MAEDGVLHILIFAKYFEYCRFVQRFWDRFRAHATVPKTSPQESNCSVFTTMLGKVIVTKVFNESDVEFLLALNDFVQWVKGIAGTKTKLQFSLIGTCGAKDYLGSTFYITRAWKYDRGTLTKGNVFSPREDKVSKSIVYLDPLCALPVSSSTAYSANFLMTSTPTFELYGGDGVFDMETYDFKAVLRANNVDLGFVLRIVSDLVGAGADEQKRQRMTTTFATLPDSCLSSVENDSVTLPSNWKAYTKGPYYSVTQLFLSTIEFLVRRKQGGGAYMNQDEKLKMWKAFVLHNKEKPFHVWGDMVFEQFREPVDTFQQTVSALNAEQRALNTCPSDEEMYGIDDDYDPQAEYFGAAHSEALKKLGDSIVRDA